jgi:hypothetical protein
MKRIVLIFIILPTLLILASQQVFSQQTEEELSTKGEAARIIYSWSNGRAWKLLNAQSKITFLNGIEEGIMLQLQESWTRFKSDSPSKKIAEETSVSLMIRGFRFYDLVQQIDDFYSDTSNIRIPIVEAYKYTLRKLRGTSKQELENYTAKLRQKYNQ